ncbi:MAG: peptidase E [Bacteroides sp.]|jgi:peptidase E|nr:peptidase E [Bacteroides sp.]
MKKILLILCIALGIYYTLSCHGREENKNPIRKEGDKTILVYGNGLDPAYIEYVIFLTGKPRPKVCFFPTAAADDPRVIDYWSRMVSDLPLEPIVIRTFISSAPGQKTFAEEILSSDAVIVGGGNTLNMLAVWKVQGIDTLLKQAYEQGIVLAGGSAGSLCWFTGGYSDSRPKALSLIEGLGFLDFSHSPHYNEPQRRSLFKEAILSGALQPGFACDDDAGLLFINGKMVKSLSLHQDRHNYYVTIKNGKISEERLTAEIIK